jgi:hypothetical protein
MIRTIAVAVLALGLAAPAIATATTLRYEYTGNAFAFGDFIGDDITGWMTIDCSSLGGCRGIQAIVTAQLVDYASSGGPYTFTPATHTAQASLATAALALGAIRLRRSPAGA